MRCFYLSYDKLSNLVQMREEVNNAANGVRVTDFTYDRDNRVTRVQYDSNSTRRVDYTYDALGRVTKRTATNGSNAYATSYTYVGGGYGTNSTTPMVAGITQSGMNFTYSYDSRGNIVSETRNGSTTTYAYDGIGQLVRVNDPHENATWVYNYDRGGNITSKVKYAYTTGTLGSAVQTISYTYDSTWKDKLIKYNGATLSYDAIGNLTSDGTWTYTWEKGHQLKQMSKSGTTIQFKYNHNGIRTQKIATVNGTTTTTNYVYHGNKLVHLTQGNNWMHFYYDGQGQPAMVNLNGTIYTYIKNLQGDIVGILDNTNTILVEYKYDIWGLSLTTTGSSAATLGKLNPFRYRGYLYDEETKLFYVTNRYYNSEYHRFISTDATRIITATLMGLTDKNLFAYCDNNPVVRVDRSGRFWDTFFDIFSFGASIFEVCTNPSDPWAWAGLAGDAFDLIPFVSGVGEITRAAKTADRVFDVVDTSHDITKTVSTVDDIADASSSGIRYTDKVLKQMSNTSDLHHAFPSIIDTMIDAASKRPIKGGDSIVRTLVEIPGSINKTSGVFEYIIEPNGKCNHRYFRILK